MIRGFYTARSGLVSHQERMNTIANNMANANTNGFKPMRTTFTDLMYQNLNRPEAETTVMTGHGVKINKNDLILDPGAMQQTGRTMDVAIEDEGGFFAVETAEGEIHYTRAGNFYLSNDDDTYYLVNASGHRVLDADGEEIEIEFNDNGEIDFDPDMIGVFRFANPYGLFSVEGTAFLETETSGEAVAIEEPKLKTAFLEGSGVSVSNEMVSVIEASKAFSLNSRMVQVADEVEQTINSLR